MSVSASSTLSPPSSRTADRSTAASRRTLGALAAGGHGQQVGPVPRRRRGPAKIHSALPPRRQCHVDASSNARRARPCRAPARSAGAGPRSGRPPSEPLVRRARPHVQQLLLAVPNATANAAAPDRRRARRAAHARRSVAPARRTSRASRRAATARRQRSIATSPVVIGGATALSTRARPGEPSTAMLAPARTAPSILGNASRPLRDAARKHCGFLWARERAAPIPGRRCSLVVDGTMGPTPLALGTARP